MLLYQGRVFEDNFLMQQIATTINSYWVDGTAVLFLLLFVVSGLSNGFIINLIDLLGFVFSFVAALEFYRFAADYLAASFSLPVGIAKGLGFVFTGFLMETIYFLIARVFYRFIPKAVIKSPVNKILGPIPAIVNAVVVLAFFLSISISLPIHPRVKEAVLASTSGKILVPATHDLEREIASIFGEAISDTLSFITIPPTSSEKVDLGFTTTSVSVDEVSERVMLELVNAERVKAGLNTLVGVSKIQIVARSYGREMFAGGFFSHVSAAGESPFDRMEEGGVEFLAAGENLAYAPNVELAHKGLMQSPGHRANILSPDYARVGIGVIDGGIYGKMFVQNFAD